MHNFYKNNKTATNYEITDKDRERQEKEKAFSEHERYIGEVDGITLFFRPFRKLGVLLNVSRS